MVRLLPAAFVSPVAGLLGDRHSRRMVLLASSTAVAVTMGCAAVAVAASTSDAVVFGLAGLATIGTAPYIPAESALLPAVARSPQELSGANVARGVMDNIGFLAAGIVSGVMLATTSPQAVFAVAAGASLLAASFLLRLHRDERPAYVSEATGRGALHETARGLATLAAD